MSKQLFSASIFVGQWQVGSSWRWRFQTKKIDWNWPLHSKEKKERKKASKETNKQTNKQTKEITRKAKKGNKVPKEERKWGEKRKRVKKRNEPI